MKKPTLAEAEHILVMMRLTEFPYGIAVNMLENYIRTLRGEPQQGWGRVHPTNPDLYPPPEPGCGRYKASTLWAANGDGGDHHVRFKQHPHLLPESYKRRHKWHKRKSKSST
jgi:hypothetical protein